MATQQELKDYLKAEADMAKMMGHSGNIGGFVLKHGCAMAPAPVNQTPRGIIKQCFRNCGLYVTGNPSGPFVYCEGYAANIFPVLHAWLLDIRTGLVHDPTWRDQTECVYYGIPFLSKYLLDIVSRAEVWSLIDQYTLGWPLLRGESPKREWFHRQAFNRLKKGNK